MKCDKCKQLMGLHYEIGNSYWFCHFCDYTHPFDESNKEEQLINVYGWGPIKWKIPETKCLEDYGFTSEMIMNHIIDYISNECPITKIKLKILNIPNHVAMIGFIKEKEGSYISDNNYVDFNNLDLKDSSWIYTLINDGVYGVSLEWLRMYPNIALFIDCMKWDGSIGKAYYCKENALK